MRLSQPVRRPGTRSKTRQPGPMRSRRPVKARVPATTQQQLRAATYGAELVALARKCLQRRNDGCATESLQVARKLRLA